MLIFANIYSEIADIVGGFFSTDGRNGW